MRFALLLVVVPFICSCSEKTMAVETGFLTKTITDADGSEHKYVVFVPKSYDAKTPTPLVVFLHGAGERGEDNEKQVAVGLGPVVRKQADTFPAIVVFPQAKRNWKLDESDLNRAIAELDAVEKEYNIDKSRVYATGLSMGGRGTWDIVCAQPDRFAAAAIICGFFDLDRADALAKIPTWFFHGEADPVVPVTTSRDAVAKLKELKADVRYNEYPEVQHDSWLNAYDEPELFTWLFAQKRK